MTVGIAYTNFEKAQLHECLKELNEKQQQALHLRFWENFSIEEIAKEMRVSWYFANELIENGISSLKEKFKDRGIL